MSLELVEAELFVFQSDLAVILLVAFHKVQLLLSDSVSMPL